MTKVRFICDGDGRHLICIPYTVENLHQMAVDLGIKRCWFHAKASYPHYDIPLRRIEEIKQKCEVVSSRELVRIMKNELR